MHIRTLFNVPIFCCSYTMAWQAKPGCVEHHRTVIERMVNAFPPAWLLPPSTGEIFDSLEQYNLRLEVFFAKKKRGYRPTNYGVARLNIARGKGLIHSTDRGKSTEVTKDRTRAFGSLRALGESQSGTTMTVDVLAIRLSPEHLRAATRP